MTSRSRLLFSGHSCSKLTGSQRRVAPSYGGHSPEGTRLNWAAPAGGMLFSRLKGEVFLHGQGSYM